MYCSRSGSASKMGTACFASRPLMSYTTSKPALEMALLTPSASSRSPLMCLIELQRGAGMSSWSWRWRALDRQLDCDGTAAAHEVHVIARHPVLPRGPYDAHSSGSLE